MGCVDFKTDVFDGLVQITLGIVLEEFSHLQSHHEFAFLREIIEFFWQKKCWNLSLEFYCREI